MIKNYVWIIIFALISIGCGGGGGGNDKPIMEEMKEYIPEDTKKEEESEEEIAYCVPPFSGTVYTDPDILTPSDPTTYLGLSYSGRGERLMFDRRIDKWITLFPYLFPARYDDGLIIEIQVNPEFGIPKAAQAQAEKYAVVIGRLPTELRKDVKTVWIHKGNQLFGGGNNNLLIHTGIAEDHYIPEGVLEETLIHEAVHTSLDADHKDHPDWLAAQEADCTSISEYARDFPVREDLAESYLPYFAIRYKADRISESLKKTIERTIPHRIVYFDNQDFDMHPVQ